MSSGGATLVRVLAWRRLADRPVRSCVAAAGVAVGVALLFSILSLNTQLASSIRETAALFSGPRLLQVTPAAPGGLPESLVDELRTEDRVATVAGLVVTRTTVSSGEREAGVFVLAGTVDAGALMSDGSMPAADQVELSEAGGDIGISRALARRLDVQAGDEMIVHASTGKTALRIAAVVSVPMFDRVNLGMVAAMPLEPAQALFGRAGHVDQIMLLAAPDADLDGLRQNLAARLDGIGMVGSPGELTGASDEFALGQVFTNSVGAIVVLAALMLVFHTMSMATAERRSEIALARSLGSTRRQLRLVTLTEAGLLGVAGTTVGLLAGALLSRVVVPLAHVAYAGGTPVDLPADVSLQVVPGAVAAAAGIGGAVMGALLPARTAARAEPIDALRPTATYEWRDPSRPSRRLAIGAVGVACIGSGMALVDRPVSGGMDDPMAALPAVLVFGGALLLVPTLIPFATRAAAAVLGVAAGATGRLAADALHANRRRTTINVMALLLPVTIVITAEVAFDGSKDTIRHLARANVAAPLNVDANTYVGGPASPVATQPMASIHQAVLQAVPGVHAVLPHQNAYIRLPDDTRGVVYAIPVAAATRAGVPEMVQAQQLSSDPGAFTGALAAGEIAASHFAARAFDLDVGASLTVPTPTGPRAFTVGAFFEDYAFQGTFFIDLDTYRAVWGDDGAHRFAIAPSDDVPLDELAATIETAVDDSAIPAVVVTRDKAVGDLVAVTTSFLPLLRAMTFAGILFGALALASAAFTAMTERRWLLTLQRTLGMTRREMARSLALEALVIGIVATIGATIVGVGLASVNNRFLGNVTAITLDISVPWPLVAVAGATGIAVALGATYFPRRTAKQMTIIEGLRIE